MQSAEGSKGDSTGQNTVYMLTCSHSIDQFSYISYIQRNTEGNRGFRRKENDSFNDTR